MMLWKMMPNDAHRNPDGSHLESHSFCQPGQQNCGVYPNGDDTNLLLLFHSMIPMSDDEEVVYRLDGRL